MYGIVLTNENRIGAVYEEAYIPEDTFVVEKLPDGRLFDYVFQDGEFVYDPLPDPEPPVPQPDPIERIAALEEQLAAALLGLN